MTTKESIEQAQSKWGQAIVHIGEAPNWDEARARATEAAESLYVLDGSLLFCPTKAADIQFRNTAEGALSYFVGKNTSFPEDKGFALEPWTAVRFENTGIAECGETVLAMGNYFFRTVEGSEVKVEYSFAYVRDAQGQWKIQLHHSAFPYNPA